MSVNSKLDCVRKVLEMHKGKDLTNVDPARDFIEAEGWIALESGIHLDINLWYDEKQGLIIKKIRSSKEKELGELPSYDTFKDETEKYRNHTYIQQLLKKLNADIQKTCDKK